LLPPVHFFLPSAARGAHIRAGRVSLMAEGMIVAEGPVVNIAYNNTGNNNGKICHAIILSSPSVEAEVGRCVARLDCLPLILVAVASALCLPLMS